MPRVPASPRPPAAPRRPLAPYPVRVPRPHRVPVVRAPARPGPRPPRSGRTAAAAHDPGEPGRNRPTGPQIQLIPAPADGALDAAGEAVDLLLDSGRAPGDILVLTTGEPHPWAAHELSFGEDAYWAQHDAA